MKSTLSPFLLGTYAPFASPHGRESFLKGLRSDSRLFDIGCGNNSPMHAKLCAPSIHYTGLDIGDYNQRLGSIKSADEYILTTPGEFAARIESFVGVFDAVVFSHNLEHCDEPDRVLQAMCRSLKPGGRMYLSFPSQASVSLPRRKNKTLNFFDDPTHTLPPELAKALAVLKAQGMRVDFLAERHRPIIPLVIGLFLEPVSLLMRRAMPLGTTWALYGFETVIWASRT